MLLKNYIEKGWCGREKRKNEAFWGQFNLPESATLKQVEKAMTCEVCGRKGHATIKPVIKAWSSRP